MSLLRSTTQLPRHAPPSLSLGSITNTTSNDLILTGMLQGSGNINLQTINGNVPDAQAFRLRGPASANYSGTITVPQSGKLELQTSVTSGSPMGTGTLVMTGGTNPTTNQGTYSLLNVRNASGLGVVSDTTFGNNVQIAGTGIVYFNMLTVAGGVLAGSRANFGDLLIGDNQTVGAVATASPALTLGFATVHLNGGNATFTPQPVGNTNFVSVENIALGTITENVAGSGITMNGAAKLTISGESIYTGTTTVSSGTLQVGEGGTTGRLGSGAVTDNALIVFNRSDNLAVPNSITGTGTVTNAGGAGNVLDLIGAQDYAVLNAISGDTHLHGAFANGTATVNVLAKLGIAKSQAIGALNISDGAIVTLDSALPSLPVPPAADFGISQDGAVAVPEPGAASLLLMGMAGIAGRRSRRISG